MKLERCHLMTLRTKERWCSRLGGLREPILTSPQAQGPREAPEALVRVSRVRQAVRHANIAVGWASIAPHSRGPEALQRGDSVEPWYVDADAQPTILAWMGSYAWQTAIAAYDS